MQVVELVHGEHLARPRLRALAGVLLEIVKVDRCHRLCADAQGFVRALEVPVDHIVAWASRAPEGAGWGVLDVRTLACLVVCHQCVLAETMVLLIMRAMSLII